MRGGVPRGDGRAGRDARTASFELSPLPRGTFAARVEATAPLGPPTRPRWSPRWQHEDADALRRIGDAADRLLRPAAPAIHRFETAPAFDRFGRVVRLTDALHARRDRREEREARPWPAWLAARSALLIPILSGSGSLWKASLREADPITLFPTESRRIVRDEEEGPHDDGLCARRPAEPLGDPRKPAADGGGACGRVTPDHIRGIYRFGPDPGSQLTLLPEGRYVHTHVAEGGAVTADTGTWRMRLRHDPVMVEISDLRLDLSRDAPYGLAAGPTTRALPVGRTWNGKVRIGLDDDVGYHFVRTSPPPDEASGASAPGGKFSAAEAAPAPPQPVASCEDAQTTLDMRICLSEELTRAEARLSAVTDSIQAELPENIDERLSRAGSEWRAYAEAECEAAALPYEGGTMVPLVVLGCRLDLANQRLTMLRSLYWNSLDEMPPAPPSS